jgi:hypothetical protein
VYLVKLFRIVGFLPVSPGGLDFNRTVLDLFTILRDSFNVPVMKLVGSRRTFLNATTAAVGALGMGGLSFLSRLPSVSAAEATLDKKTVQFGPETEKLVRFLEDTPRERLLEEVGRRIQQGLSYREVLTALLLAGVRNIQPRPVGFKFHSVLVVNSAHLASLSSPDSDRWLPIFWALDYFKSAQAQDVAQGDWTMGQVNESKIPTAQRARAAFVAAMNDWDESAADTAVTGLARTAGAQEVFEIFCRFGARDFREIGHKAIYVANSWRTLQAIGWRHAEPVLRSLAYALLDRAQDSNPAKSDHAADRPWRQNLEFVGKIRAEWLDGAISPAATIDFMNVLRHASAAEASEKVVDLLNAQVSPKSIWDALFSAAAEMLMRRPGIVSLHALTSTNALHFGFQTNAIDETRRMLLLQTAAFLTLFRGDPESVRGQRLDQLAPTESEDQGSSIESIFREISHDRMSAARRVLVYANENRDATAFINEARRLVFLKGNNAHDYKFSSAVLEDFQNVSPEWRARYLAASVFNLRGSNDTDNQLVKRTRAALG